MRAVDMSELYVVGTNMFAADVLDYALDAGVYRARFTRRGLYRYLCTYHPATMKGTIRVR